MKKEESVAVLITKTILKTITILFMVMVIFALGFYVINPRASAQICSNLGWGNCEISCYELLYARNKDSSDLYNLIVKLGGQKEYKKQNNYIAKLKSLNKYDDFCTSMDSSVLEEYSNGKIEKKNLAILYGTNEYLTSAQIVNLIKLGEYETAYQMVLETKQSDKFFELVMYYYVENLYASELSNDAKTQYINNIKIQFADYLQNKIDASCESDPISNILNAYKILKIRYVQYILSLNGEESQIAYANWQSSQQYYNNLINN